MKAHNHNRPVYINGPRVYFTPFMQSDAELLHSWINDHTARWKISNRDPITMESERDWITKSVSYTGMHLGIMKKNTDGDDVLIGTIGAFNIRHNSRKFEVGINIGDTGMRGQGFGQEATMILLNHMFKWKNMRKAIWRAYMPNKPSHKCAKGCGFAEEAVFKEEEFLDGAYINLTRYALFVHDFEPVWETFKKEHNMD